MSTAIVCGYSKIGTAAFAGLLETGVKVLALFTYPQKPDEMWFEPPEVLAKRHNIPIYKEANFNTDEVYQRISALKPDFLFSLYFREMIQERFLKIPRLGAYNLHGSLLPKYRGRAPINWVLVNGETETAMSLHVMTPKPDDGDIVAQVKIPLAWDETALSLTNRGAEISYQMMREVVPKMAAGTAEFINQKTLGASTYFGGRKPEDGELHFDWPVAKAFNLIRAVTGPWPNAFIKNDKGTIYIPWALPSSEKCAQGKWRLTQEGVLLGFADGALRIHTMKYQNEQSDRPSDHAKFLQSLLPQL